jgi:hypothetical protein
MMLHPEFQRYLQRRDSIYGSLEKIRLEIESWIETYGSSKPSLSSIAILEALHAEKARTLAQFEEMEADLIGFLLKLRAEASQSESLPKSA